MRHFNPAELLRQCAGEGTSFIMFLESVWGWVAPIVGVEPAEPVVIEDLVALTGIEGVNSRFGSVHHGSCDSKLVQFVRLGQPQTSRKAAGVGTRLSLVPR